MPAFSRNVKTIYNTFYTEKEESGGMHSSVFRGGMWPWPPRRKVRKHFWARYTVKNGISNLYILLKSALKMQEMPFQRPKFQKLFGGPCPGPPYNCVVTMASPSLKSWLRHWACTPINLFDWFGPLYYEDTILVLLVVVL